MFGVMEKMVGRGSYGHVTSHWIEVAPACARVARSVRGLRRRRVLGAALSMRVLVLMIILTLVSTLRRGVALTLTIAWFLPISLLMSVALLLTIPRLLRRVLG